MLDAPAITAKPSARHRAWLLLALIPIVAGTLWLASWPPNIHRAYVTADGKYVVTATQLAFDPGLWEVRRLDLRTGRTIRMPQLVTSTNYGHMHDDRWVTGTANEQGFTSLSVIRLDDFSEKRAVDPHRWKLAPQILDEQRLIGFDREGHLLIVNQENGSEQHFPLPAANANRSTMRVSRPDRALIWERPVGRGRGKHRLISLTKPITQLAEWNSTLDLDTEDGDCFYSFNADTDRLELISLEDGTIVEEYSLAPIFEQFPAAQAGRVLPQRKMLCIVDASQSRCLLYKFDSREVFDCLPTDLAGLDISKDESFLVMGRGLNGVSIFDMETRSTRWLHQHGQALVTKVLSPDESHLITVCYDGSVQVLDVRDGKVLRTYRNHAAIVPVFGVVSTSFIAWCSFWVRVGVRLKSSPLADAILFNGLVAAAFIVRVNLSGSMQDPGRFAYQTAQSLFASWLVLLTCWVVFGKTRWTLRILAPLLGIAGTFAIVLVNFRGDHYGVWQLVVGAAMVSVVCAMWFGLLKRWGWTLNREGSLPRPVSTERRGIPLRDLFLITAAVAALLAVVRFVSPHMFAAREAWELSIIVTTVSMTGVVATWAGLGPSHWCWRLVLLTLIVLAAGSVLPAAFANIRHWQNWVFITKNHAFIALFACGTALIFRAYDWRLRRALSDGCNNANQC